MLSNELVHLEMLADMYIESVDKAKQLLENGQANACLHALDDLHQQLRP